VLLWQVSQDALVTIWLAGLPSAATPLWQAAQPPMMPACDIFAGPDVAAVMFDAAVFPAIGPGAVGLVRGARVVAGLPGVPAMVAAAFGAAATAGAVPGAGAVEAGLGAVVTAVLGITAGVAGVATGLPCPPATEAAAFGTAATDGATAFTGALVVVAPGAAVAAETLGVATVVGAAVAAVALGVFVSCVLGVAEIAAAAFLVAVGAVVGVAVGIAAVVFATVGDGDGVGDGVGVDAGTADGAGVGDAVAAGFAAAALLAPPSSKLVVLWQVPQSAVVLGWSLDLARAPWVP
jgi:hypothetical protein